MKNINIKNTLNLKKSLRILRLIFYICFFVTFIIIPTTYFEEHKICFLNIVTNKQCPTCGITRAFSSLMHFKFKDAFYYNQPFVLILFPIAMIIIINDIINIFIEFILKKETCSYLEHLFKI